MDKLEVKKEKLVEKINEVNEIDEQIKRLEEEKKDCLRWLNAKQAENSAKFRKKRSRLLVQLGGEFVKYADVKIVPDSDFEEIFEKQAERMNKIYNSLLRCPDCGALLLREESKKHKGKFFWYCEKKCGWASRWEKNGVPQILGD